MLYLVTGEWVEDPTTAPEEFATLWEKIVRPSLEALSKIADEKKTGGVFAGQRMGVLIVDASSHEELGRTLANLPFWSRLKWNVTPLESYRSAIERDSKAMENLKSSKR
jgi:muconolactone delta-isomerase